MNQERMDTMDRTKQAGYARAAVIQVAILALWAISSARPGLAQQSPRQTFASAEEASQSLFQAVQGKNGQATVEILGGSSELVSSRDEASDKVDLERFVQKYQEMHRLAREGDGTVILYIGAENWPFPVPLVATGGAWHFDHEAGLKEVLFRRIGENELTAIEICHDLIVVDKQLRTTPTAADRADSPLASLVSSWASESADGSDPILIHGYYFRPLAMRPKSGSGPHASDHAAGGFGFIAYPAEYRSSGVMTFAVSGTDVVYEKDLGPNTSTLAAGIRALRKDATWRAADQ
jgi:Protein of unknown function (DUF2950)